MVIRFPRVNSLIDEGGGEMHMSPLRGVGSLRAARCRSLIQDWAFLPHLPQNQAEIMSWVLPKEALTSVSTRTLQTWAPMEVAPFRRTVRTEELDLGVPWASILAVVPPARSCPRDGCSEKPGCGYPCGFFRKYNKWTWVFQGPGEPWVNLCPWGKWRRNFWDLSSCLFVFFLMRCFVSGTLAHCKFQKNQPQLGWLLPFKWFFFFKFKNGSK